MWSCELLDRNRPTTTQVYEMRVLVACEYSGVVREAFRKRGHDAWSCDLLPSDDESEYHHECPIEALLKYENAWDLMIAHPPCDYLTIAAEWAYSDGPYHQKVKPETLVGEKRLKAREEAIKFATMLYHCAIPRVCIENPVGVLTRFLGKPQYIQPYQFGEDASKKTGLWLKNLPPLVPTKYVEPRMVGTKKRWSNQTDSGQNNLSPSPDRWKLRSKTYQGIADAMAEQWGHL